MNLFDFGLEIFFFEWLKDYGIDVVEKEMLF